MITATLNDDDTITRKTMLGSITTYRRMKQNESFDKNYTYYIKFNDNSLLYAGYYNPIPGEVSSLTRFTKYTYNPTDETDEGAFFMLKLSHPEEDAEKPTKIKSKLTKEIAKIREEQISVEEDK